MALFSIAGIKVRANWEFKLTKFELTRWHCIYKRRFQHNQHLILHAENKYVLISKTLITNIIANTYCMQNKLKLFVYHSLS